MGSYLIKPDLDVDMYVWWSSTSDSPVLWGSKRQLKRLYKKRKWMFRLGEDFKDKLKLADEYGVSLRHRDIDEGVRVANATLPRANILAYLKIYETDLSMSPGDPKLIWLADQWDLD